MAFLLGFGSAVEWIRLANDEQLAGQMYGLSPLSLEGSRRRLERHLKSLEHLTLPIQLVVAFAENRRPSAVTACHMVSLPYEDYHGLRIKRGLYCSVPALTYLQMASVLDEEQLLMLGFELCGRYGFDTEGRLVERQQHCTPQILSGRAEAIPKVRNRRKALTVATEVLGGAASSMEAALAIILSGNPARGGFGLPAPELNHPLPVTGATRTHWASDHITPDLLWEDAKLVIECSEDARRSDVLSKLGYRVVTIASEHMSNPTNIERLATMVAERLGCALPEVDAFGAQQRHDLQERLLKLAADPSPLLGF